MSTSLYPLTYKPGIKRDGSTFQPEYCTDGQWVRFHHGKIKKMGGLLNACPISETRRGNYIKCFPTGDGKTTVYIGQSQGISILTLDEDFNPISLVKNAFEFKEPFGPEDPNTVDASWQKTIVQSATIIHNGVQHIAFLCSLIGNDINQNSSSLFLSTKPGPYEIKLLDNNTIGIDSNINGGLCYASPYLFIYGSNGVVQYSRNEDPFNFKGGDSGKLKISSDKVIYGVPIRGGSNSPSLLFWTLSSVVRVINTGTDKVEFQIDTISNSSSIISTRSVVEYDGLFFWPGTDRFYVYNGVVQEMVNNINFDYFFDNVDLRYRQRIFGVRQPKYGEIWWFYPEKLDAPGRDETIPEGTITRAIIYNKKENSWYDTKITGDAGCYYEEKGKVLTYGLPFVVPTEEFYEDLDHAIVPYYGVWVHDTGTTQIIRSENPVRGEIINVPIPAYIVTPTISRAAFNQSEQGGQGVDRWVSVERFEPDFVMSDRTDKIGIRVHTKKYAQSAEVSIDPVEFDGITEKIDFRVQGRHIFFTLYFLGHSSVETGQCMISLKAGDRQ